MRNVTKWCLIFTFLLSCGSYSSVDAADKKAKKKEADRENETKNGGSRKHITETLYKARPANNDESTMKNTMKSLLDIYKSSIQRLENAYRYGDLNKDALLEAEIVSEPLILFLGPWSTGKTTMINYLLGLEDSQYKLRTGAEPVTKDFVIIQHGPRYRTVKGMQLVSDKDRAFQSLEKFGLKFLEKLQGIEYPSPLLDLITIVDSPGILENRKQQERGYLFNEVVQWFLQRASIIFLVFDPTKLEVGKELEAVFNQLKSYEGKVRLLLNKADTIPQQDLMRVYGALFWSLAPMVNSVEPPRVYVGSFWSQRKDDHPMAQLFYEEEVSLLLDISQAVENQVQNKIAYVRRHAFLVRLHALVVDSFISTFHSKKSIIWDNTNLWVDIVHKPGKYGVFTAVLKEKDISKHDLPKSETYIEFFTSNSLDSFRPLSSYGSFFSGSDIDGIANAITHQLPNLLDKLKDRLYNEDSHCTKETCL